MDFNVSQLLKGLVGTSRRHEIDFLLDTIDGQYTLLSPLHGEVKLTRTDRGILAEASITTTVRLQCSRCLEEMEIPLTVRFREEFLPTVDIATGVPVAVPDEDHAFTIDEHHILDLREPTRQYALLELPMQPLCRRDCAGLCPICGENLNQGQCDCKTEGVDSRLAPLLGLLLGQDEDADDG